MMHDGSIQPARLAAVLLGVLFTIGQCGQRAAAQYAADDAGAAEQHEALFAEIAAEVAALERQGALLKKVVRFVRPSVVHIEAEKEDDFSARVGRKPVEEAGSGAIVELDGRYFVLTNRHVIKESTIRKIKIGLADGRRLYPMRIWSDSGTDVAVLEISAERLVPAKIGDSRKLDIGDFVLAVGSPFGLSHSVTYGIISAKGRRDLELGDDGVDLQDFLQTDAAINPGNSGGPLLNLRGEVVGINAAIASSSGGNEGIGFSIPINMVMVVAKQLIEHGSVVHAYLGVRLDAEYTAEKAARLGLPRRLGARVTSITPRSPAEAASILAGDVILSFDGVSIDDDSHLINQARLTPVGKEVDIELIRNNQIMSVKVRVGLRDEFEP